MVELSSYVYKYEVHKIVVYVGINNTDLHRRIRQHESNSKDPLCHFLSRRKGKVFYCEFPNPTSAKLMESLLIDRYKPIYNREEKYEGACELFAEVKEPQWKAYDFQEKTVCTHREYMCKVRQLETAKGMITCAEKLLSHEIPVAEDGSFLISRADILQWAYDNSFVYNHHRYRITTEREWRAEQEDYYKYWISKDLQFIVDNKDQIIQELQTELEQMRILTMKKCPEAGACQPQYLIHLPRFPLPS